MMLLICSFGYLYHLHCLIGGVEGRGRRGAEQGHVSLWHLPSRTMTASASTVAPLQDAVFHEDELLTVGAESVVRHWGRHSLQCRSRIMASPPSCFSLAINRAPAAAKAAAQQILTVAGSSPFVDVFANFSNRAFSLRFEK